MVGCSLGHHKILRKLGGGTAELQRFEREARALAALVILLTAAVGLAWAVPAAAQTAGTGGMIARAVAPDNVPLPGAMIFLEGPLGTNTQYTAIDGNARILGLMPGDYTATFSLSGFKTVVRGGLRITVGRTVSVTVNMELSAVEETITVTGEIPVVDVKHTTVGSLYTDDLINMTPTASGIWAGVLDHVPGVVTEWIDVGGAESGQQPGFRAYGSVGTQNQYRINGLPTTDPVARNSSMMAYVSIGSFEEVAVETASHDIEMQGPGVMLNQVVKSGSNDYRGAIRMFYTNDEFVSSNVDDRLADAGVGEGNPSTLLRDLDLQVGGPIFKSRAWFFVDYWNFRVERLIVGVPETDPDDTSLTNWTLNTTIQLSANNKLNVRYFTGRKFRSNRGASRTEDPARARNQDSFHDAAQLQFQSVLGRGTFLDLRFSNPDVDFPLQARHPAGTLGVVGRDGAAKEPHANFLDVPYTFDLHRTGLLNPFQPDDDEIGWPRESNNLRDRLDLGGSVTHYVAGENQSHDLKFGGDYGRFWEHYLYNRAYGMSQYLRTVGGVPLTPARVRLYNTNPLDMFQIKKPYGMQNNGSQISLYAQDTWTIKNRLTLNLGVRWDRSNSWYADQKRAESYWPSIDPVFREADIEAWKDIVVWSDLVPRIGVIYDLRGDGRTALKASYSRYSEWQGVTWARGRNPNGVSSFYYNWSDANGDGRFQLGEQTNLRSKSIAGITSELDPDLTSPLTDEITVGAEHELMEGFLLSASYIWRDRKNIIEDINIGEPYGRIAEALGVESLWFPVQVQDPGLDGLLGTADDGDFLTVWGHPDSFDNHYLHTNPANYGFDTKWGYNGIEVVAQKRWSDNWQMLASYNTGVARIFDNVGNNPNQDVNANGTLSSYDRPHMIRVTGNYLFAEPIGVNVGIFLRVNSGSGRIRYATFYDLDYPELLQGGVTVRAHAARTDPLGPEAYDWVKILDIRAEKQFTVGKYGVLHSYLDVFNAFNVNTITSGASTVTSPLYGTNDFYYENDAGEIIGSVYGIVPPRLVRIGGAWDFG